MKVGMELPVAGEVAGTQGIAQVAEAAEGLGLDTLWSFERLLAPTTMDDFLPELYRTVFSPLEVLAFAAARTSRVRLGTSIIVAPLHNPVDLARRFATVDQLSGGRLIAGLGQGWMPEEFELARVTKKHLGDGFGELVEAMRAAWGPDPVSFEGERFRFPASWIGPKPVQPGGPPILVAASAPASIRRTARAGFGLNPVWTDWDKLTTEVTSYREAAREAGHDLDTLSVVLRVNGDLTDEDQGTEPTPSGSVDQARDVVPRLTELGVTEVFWSMRRPVEEQLTQLERLLSVVK